MGRHRADRPLLERVGRATARSARVVTLVWVVAAALALATALGALGGGSLFDRLTSGSDSVPGDSRTGRELLDARATTGPQLLVALDGVGPTSTNVRRRVEQLERRLADVPGVQQVSSPYDAPGGLRSPQARALVARDQRGLLVSVALERGLDGERTDAAVAGVRAEAARAAAGIGKSSARVGGVPLLVTEITDQVEADLRTGESIAFAVSLVVMVLVFGGFLAAGLPLAGAVVSIAGALLSLYAFASVVDLDSTVVNVVTVLGLGLSIDYGLLVVSRFREEIAARPGGATGPVDRAVVVDAVGRTVARAGRTVTFSALIVAISLCGLLFFQTTVLRAIGAAAVSVVLVALLVALLLVPALLGLLGHRLVRPPAPGRSRRLGFGDVAPEVGVFSRLARRVQRRPWWVVAGVLALLVAAALPALTMQLRSSGTQLLPQGADQRSFFAELDRRYPAAAGADVTVVARAAPARLRSYVAEVADLPGVVSVEPPRAAGDLAVVGVRVKGGDESGPVATDVVRRLRELRPPFRTYVVGQAAETIDFVAGIERRAPIAIGVVVAATVALLFLMTGSVLVPLKALVLNVVSLGASLGVLVLVFQDGALQDVLGFTSAGGIETTIPPLVLAFGFGLSMDYEVFLLARIKEQYDAGLPNDAAVVRGLQQSGRIITCAALLVVIVFSGFAAGKLLIVKQTGVALVVAVLVDATLVRMLLVPATMTLLGERNWWAPAPLRRLHERIGMSH